MVFTRSTLFAHIRAASLGALLLTLLAGAAACARAAEPTDVEGNVGRTSYATLPFQRQVFGQCWGCSPFLVPGELYFWANPGSPFNNPATMATARSAAAALERSGIVPSSGAQRWEDTYAAAFPVGTFPGAPAGVAADATARNGVTATGAPAAMSADPAFVAWRDFVTGHPQYWDTAFDGGTMPSEPTYYRAWGGQWGHISPLTPLAPADCPPGRSLCTYGDLFAYQWGRTARLSGGYGMMLSDFTDSQPERSSNFHDFNPAITGAFAQATGLPVPQGGVAAQAQWIVANALPAWNDYLSQGYGSFFASLAAQLGHATGRQALIVGACAVTPSFRRWSGTDERILVQHITPSSFVCSWDDQTIQVGRYGPVVAPPMQELAGYVIGAAREPLVRNGAILEADDPAYWAAIRAFYPTLGAAAQLELGRKLLKRLWTWSAWAHIADRGGNVRRALAFVSRDYWDLGSLTALDPLTTLIRSIVPTQPFGAALYYSTAVERIREQQQAAAVGVGKWVNFYLANPVLQSFIDQGGVVGYYVSDTALGSIVKGQANAPSAWVVLDAQGTLPDGERRQLAAIAPIVASVAAQAGLPNQPLGFTGGLTGFGFYDQTHRAIVVVSNPSTLADAGTRVGSIRLAQLPGTSCTATDLFTGAATSLPVSGGQATMPISVARWDTHVLAFTTP